MVDLLSESTVSSTLFSSVTNICVYIYSEVENDTTYQIQVVIILPRQVMLSVPFVCL